MRFARLTGIVCTLLLGAASARPVHAADVPEIRIDVPVVLSEARIVFNSIIPYSKATSRPACSS